MTEEQGPVKPQSEVLYLLGGLNAKMDAVLLAQTSYDDRLNKLEIAVATVQASERPKAPWYSVSAGIGSIVALVLGGIALLKVLNP